MRVIHAYNQHRGGGGSDNATRATIELMAGGGIETEVFTRSSEDLPKTPLGRLKAGTSAIYAGDSVKAFSTLLSSFKPDVVHVHEVFPLVSPWILPRCTKLGIPVVKSCVDFRLTCPIVTHLYKGQICTMCTGGREHWAVLRNCRDSIPESLTVAFYNAMTRNLRLFSDHVARYIAPSEFAREWLMEHARIPASRITTLSPVVRIPDTAADPASGDYVAYAGRLTTEKGIETLIEAARLCKLPIRIARAENSLMNVNVPEEISVVTTRGFAELSAFFRGARMLLVPSIWFETFGLTAAEAMAHGVPIVASRIGALSDLVEDGVDGVLFEAGNARDLADKITRLWNDKEACRSLGKAAREKAMREWPADRHVQRLKGIYEDVLNGRHPS